VSRHSAPWLADTGAHRGRARTRPDVRASDAERESVVRALRSHYAAGRLDREELRRCGPEVVRDHVHLRKSQLVKKR